MIMKKKILVKKVQTEEMRDMLLMVLGSTKPKDIAAYLGFAITFIDNKDLMFEFAGYLKKTAQLSIKINKAE